MNCLGQAYIAETGLDYFGARYFSAAQGRFTTPDQPLADQYPEDPQSWNMYGYVRNNPLKNTDPNGRDCLQGLSSCGSYILGGMKAVGNLVPDTATLLNRGINLLTGSNIPDAPRFGAANVDEAQGMEAAGVMMLLSPIAEAGTARIATAAETVSGTTEQALKSGSFSITDWTGYPAGVPKPPAGSTFRLVEGTEYQTARTAANQANQAIRQADPAAYAGKEIHEISPVKFGGSPN